MSLRAEAIKLIVFSEMPITEDVNSANIKVKKVKVKIQVKKQVPCSIAL